MLNLDMSSLLAQAYLFLVTR